MSSAGAQPTTFAAIATSSRAARWASTSLPRGLPDAVTATAPVAACTVSIAAAHAAPP